MDCATETSSNYRGSGGFLINELVEKISGNDKQVQSQSLPKTNPYERPFQLVQLEELNK